MREYETVFVLHPSIDDKEVDAEVQALRELITSTGGTVEDVERWGRRRLAYEIQKVHEATYTLIRFHAQGPTLAAIDRRFRLNEKMLRYLTVLSEGPPPPPPRPETPEEGRDHPEEDFELPRSGSGYGSYNSPASFDSGRGSGTRDRDEA